MKDVIDQFMWAYQQSFRMSLEREIQRALSKIGLEVNVRVLLVGFADDDEVRHRICIEPEDGPLSVDDLSKVSDRAHELQNADPESQMIVSNPRLRVRRYAKLKREARADALVEVIEETGVFEGFEFFASASTLLDSYEVHTCVGVPAGALRSLPTLDDDTIRSFGN